MSSLWLLAELFELTIGYMKMDRSNYSYNDLVKHVFTKAVQLFSYRWKSDEFNCFTSDKATIMKMYPVYDSERSKAISQRNLSALRKTTLQ